MTRPPPLPFLSNHACGPLLTARRFDILSYGAGADTYNAAEYPVDSVKVRAFLNAATLHIPQTRYTLPSFRIGAEGRGLVPLFLPSGLDPHTWKLASIFFPKPSKHPEVSNASVVVKKGVGGGGWSQLTFSLGHNPPYPVGRRGGEWSGGGGHRIAPPPNPAVQQSSNPAEWVPLPHDEGSNPLACSRKARPRS